MNSWQQQTELSDDRVEEKDAQPAVAQVQTDIDDLVCKSATLSLGVDDYGPCEATQPRQASVSLPTLGRGHDIKHVSAHGHSSVHVGDVYNITYLEPVEIQSLGLCLGLAPLLDANNFIGRVAEIDSMHNILHSGKAFTGQQRLVLGGMGGVGKTQLAISYARLYSYEYSTVLWLNATSKPTLMASFRTVARSFIKASELATLDGEQILARVNEWLCQPRNTRWLLIFDNYDEPDQFNIDDFCPNVGHGCIVITTRLPDEVTGQQVRVDPLRDIDESLGILEVRSGRENVSNDPGARKLAKRLGGFPLALATAGAYLRRSTTTFGQYLGIYEQRWKIDPRRTLQLQEYQDRTMYTTWNLSHARLQKNDPDAALMLKLFTYFDNHDVRYELLQGGEVKNLPVWLQESMADRFHFESVVGTLVEYCFIEAQHTSQSYSLHNCVHDWTLGELNKVLDPQLYWYAISCVIAEVHRLVPPLQSPSHLSRITRHALRQAHPVFIQGVLADVADSEHLGAVNGIAGLLVSQGLYQAAVQMYSKALAVSKKIEGPRHKLTIRIATLLGITYQTMGKLSEAEDMFRCILAVQKRGSSAFRAIQHLGVLYQDQGRLEQAEYLLKQALAQSDRFRGTASDETLRVVTALGKLYYVQRKLTDAMEMYNRAYSTYERQFMTKIPSGTIVDSFARVIAHTMWMLEPGSVSAHFRLALLVRLLVDAVQDESACVSWLGRCLLHQSDDTNAQMAYQYSIRHVNDHTFDFGNVYCDGCRQNLCPETGRHVCRQCPDTDLCNPCLRKCQRRELQVLGCSDHNYFTVSTNNLLNTKPITEWLNDLAVAYGITRFNRNNHWHVEISPYGLFDLPS